MTAETKKLIGTIDSTPTWEAVLPIYLEAAQRGNAAALAELQRMARLADLYNALEKARMETSNG